LIGGASKWKKGQILQKQVAVDQGVFTLQAKYLEKRAGDFVIEFSWEPQTLHFADVLHLTGQIPLPPYLKRDAEPQDKDRYQTIYAALDGSVAAPTAGLHFTPRIFERLAALGIQRDFVTLHVGAGTFKPVKSDSLAQHVMHEEYLEVSRTTIRRLREQNGRPLLAVGTTALRTLESLYWLGLKVMSEPAMDPRELTIQQWDAYTHPAVQVAASESLDALELWLVKQGVEKIWTKTALLIAPGYEFKLVDGLITNFHQPESTLLLLVAAFLGQDWTRVYKYALENQFRFLSYGDGSLLFRPSSAPS
jgi:S-adenosylmethionine:tRNA ribosyltransferase-isomerase